MKLLVYIIALISAYLGWWMIGSVQSLVAISEDNGIFIKDSLIMSSYGWFPAGLLFLLAISIVVIDLTKKHQILPYIAAVTLISCFLTIRLYPEILLSGFITDFNN